VKYVTRFEKTSNLWFYCPPMQNPFLQMELDNLYGERSGGKRRKLELGQCICSTHAICVELILLISHKWWHRIYFFMLDTTISNMWIVHSDISFRFLQDPMTHLNFQLQLARDLAKPWSGRNQGYSIFSANVASAHGPKSMGKKRGNCLICGRITNQFYPGCRGHIYKSDCYWDTHW
jgi:hypothetical protein